MKLFTANNAKNSNIIKFATIGVVLLFASTLIILNDPVQMIVDSQLAMRTGSLLYSFWIKPPLEVLLKVYIFNITNLEEFKLGIDKKLKLQEIGPYVYQEFLENVNASFHDNNTLSYLPKRHVKFLPEYSVGDPEVDRIIAPNIPYMGVTSAISSISSFAAFGLRVLTKQFNAQSILDISVNEYLWGYDDPMIHMASKIVPSFINFERFGLLDRMFDEGDNLITIRLPDKNKSNSNEIKKEFREYSIESWNGKKGIGIWGFSDTNNKSNTACNTLNGAYDGTLFPRNISSGETFRVYRKAFCKTLPITYSHPGKFNGIDVLNFKLPENAFETNINDPDTACFCQENKCLKRGLGNITPCYYNIPLALSFPHFFNADPSLLDEIEGLYPIEAKHGTEIAIQPQLGIPMRVHSRFQANLLMGDIKFNSDMSRFRNTVLPIFWFDIGIETLPPHIIFLLQLLFKIAPYAQLGAIILFTTAGVSLVGTSLLLYIWLPTAWNSLNVTMEHTLSVEAAKMTNVSLMPLLKQSKNIKGQLCKQKMGSKPEYELIMLPFEKELDAEDFVV